MGNIISAFFRLGVLLTYAGVGLAFIIPNDVIFSYVLLGMTIAYLLQSMWTANRPIEYNSFQQCFNDIANDISAYTILLFLIFGWFISNRFIAIPLSNLRFWGVVAFLATMCLITLAEMVITIRSCLMGLDRRLAIVNTRYN